MDFYYVGGGSGSGLILLIAICCLLYWCCKKTQEPETRLPTCVAYTDPENPNMMHTRMGAISTHKYSVRRPVGIQDPVGTQSKVMNDDIQYAFATALLDQLEDYSADVNEHHRRLRIRQYSAKLQIEAEISLEIQSEQIFAHILPSRNYTYNFQ